MKAKDYELIRAYAIKFHGPTDTKGARVSVTHLFDNKRVYLAYDYALGKVLEQGISYLEESAKEEVIGWTSTKNNGYIVAVAW